MSTVMKMASKVELWKNTASGMRWYLSFDLQGREATKTVPGGRTFTLTTFDRQLNQERAATAEQDLFRNGTFVLARKSEETDEEEIFSPNALTDKEIETVVNDVVYGDLKIADVIDQIDSGVTLFRLQEAFVLEDETPEKVIKAIKKKRESLEPTPVNEREIVSTSPEE